MKKLVLIFSLTLTLNSYSEIINEYTLPSNTLHKQGNPMTFTVQNVENTGAYLYTNIYNEESEMFPQRGAGIEITLLKEPKEDVLLSVRLENKDKVGFRDSDTLTKTLYFNAGEGWDSPQAVTIIDKDVNNTQPYTLYTDTFESNDSTYNNSDPKDIVITPHATIEFIEPPLRKRKGAIRGVRVEMLLYAKSGNVETFKLINPPLGMRLESPPMHTINEFNDMSRSATTIVWDVPIDIEEKTYNITVEATDTKGKKGSISFPVKVPQTRVIQTKIENNELIVIDKSSNLYGMKMKGHSDEDISGLRLRSVAYEDVWKKRIKMESTEDVLERTVFVIDNMPEALDVKMPEYMDTYSERINIGMHSYKYRGTVLFTNNSWERATRQSYLYDNTNGYVYLQMSNDSEVFLIVLEQAQNKGK